MRRGPWLGAVLAFGLAATASAASLGGRPDLDQLAGVYKARFANGDVSGNRFQSENVLEVVKLSPRTAYFRIHSEFFNGHLCALWGVADLEADALVYRSHNLAENPCVLKFRATREGVVFDDVGDYCREGNCGARGGFGLGDEVNFKFSQKRRIRYMPILLKSNEYAQAVKEHDGAKAAKR